MIKVLAVDDSALMRRLLGNVFQSQEDFEVVFARDGVEALARLHEFQPDVVTLDIHMPNMDGLACLDRIMVERPTRVVMVSALTEAGAEETLEAMQLGAVDFITKPDGAMSLAMDDFGPILIEKVRSASKARLRASLRLTERVRLRAGAAAEPERCLRFNSGRHGLPLDRQPLCRARVRVLSIASWSSARQRGGLRRSTLCFRRYLPIFRGPFSSRSTCRPRSPDLSRVVWIACAL